MAFTAPFRVGRHKRLPYQYQLEEGLTRLTNFTQNGNRNSVQRTCYLRLKLADCSMSPVLTR